MASKKNTGLLQSRGWKKGVAMLYGIGAAVVIIGALFKILHFPGADEMLIVGLGTEAVIFFVSAFEPLPEDERHYSWHKVFPQLAEDVDEEEVDLDATLLDGGSNNTAVIGAGVGKVNGALQDAELGKLFESLADSIHGLKVNVTNLADISDATVATNDFSDKLRQASSKIDGLNKGYTTTVEVMNSFGNSVNDIKAYQTQVQAVTKNLTSLNTVYSTELENSQKQLATVNQYYGNLGGVMKNLVDTQKDTENLRNEVVAMSKNLHALNGIYGGMLNAMAAAGAATQR